MVMMSETTEILNMEEQKWKLLSNGHLPGNHRFRNGLRLATVNNNVFAFGIIKNIQDFRLISEMFRRG